MNHMNILLFSFEAVSCLFWHALSLCHPCYHSCSYRLYRVTTHEHYIALVVCEVRSVNFLKQQTFNHSRKACLEINMKQLTKVGIELDR